MSNITNLHERRAARRAKHQQPPTITSSTHSFYDIQSLCKFVAEEIVSSGRNYNNIAKAADVAQGTVSRMAKGETHYPRAATVLQILRALGHTVMVRSGANQ